MKSDSKKKIKRHPSHDNFSKKKESLGKKMKPEKNQIKLTDKQLKFQRNWKIILGCIGGTIALCIALLIYAVTIPPSNQTTPLISPIPYKSNNIQRQS